MKADQLVNVGDLIHFCTEDYISATKCRVKRRFLGLGKQLIIEERTTDCDNVGTVLPWGVVDSCLDHPNIRVIVEDESGHQKEMPLKGAS